MTMVPNQVSLDEPAFGFTPVGLPAGAYLLAVSGKAETNLAFGGEQ